MRSKGTLLDLIETMDAGSANVQRLFGGERGARSVRRRRQANPRYQRDLYEAMRLVADVYEGHKPVHYLREAMGTADFPNLFADIIDRQLLANYRETPYTYRNYVKVGQVNDFRNVKRYAMNGAEATLPAVGQQAPYPEVSLSDQVFQYSVGKFGKRIPFDWETMVNDDLDALKDVPARFGRAARRTEEKFATQLFVDANGPLASFYNTANKNRIHTENGATSNNPPLSIQALQDAMTVLDSMVDADGEPIIIEAVELVVPPSLRVIANNILNSTELWINLNDTSTSPPQQQLHTQNWVKGMVRLSVNYYIPRVAVSANGATTWFLFANPSVSRPALEMSFLRGHEVPEIAMKTPNLEPIGGGPADAFNGDFDTDSIHYRVRHVMGGTQIDNKATVASNGSGT